MTNHSKKEQSDTMASTSMIKKTDSDSGFVNPAFVHTHNDSLNNPDMAEYPQLQKSEQDISGNQKNSESAYIEKDKIEKGKKEKPRIVGVKETFRFATCTDKLLMLMGTMAAGVQGAALPLLTVIFGNMTDSFIKSETLYNNLAVWIPLWTEVCHNLTQEATPLCNNLTMDYLLDDPIPPTRFRSVCVTLGYPVGCDTVDASGANSKTLLEEMMVYATYFAILGICVIFIGYLQVLGWQTAAYNQSQRVRTKLFWSILRMEIGWFDTHEVGELNTRISDDVARLEAGIGDKLSMFFQHVATFLTGIIIGFVLSWRLTLVILAFSPLMALSGILLAKVGAATTSKELYSYAKAGAIAEEVFGAIRTVVAFGGQEKECERYNKHLYEARDIGVKRGVLSGCAMGLVFLPLTLSYGLSFWYGSKLVFDGQLSAGTIVTVFYSVLSATFFMGNAMPYVQDFTNARGAAYAVYGIIDMEPTIDSSSPAGRKDEDITGNVEFRNIYFSYPARPSAEVLRGLNMKIQVGQTVALVGPSGCGKSTTVQLLQRFYDSEVGQILMDGTDIRDFNIKWLRQQIGVVSQEPVLFATTIAENIRHGNDDVTDDAIIRACEEANAHDFISKLPEQYETLVGERGAQLSGGQKQRIAIARALVRNPKILLLDEATSALDTECEATVQAALDKVRTGRTTMVIAHRLSTIRTADVIVSLQDGVVTEQGTHEELMARQGLYYELVMNQQNDEDAAGTGIVDEKSESQEDTHLYSNGVESKTDISSLHHDDVTQPHISTEVHSGSIWIRLVKMNAPEWPLLATGCLFSLAIGGIQTSAAVIFSFIFKEYSSTDADARNKAYAYSAIFFGQAFIPVILFTIVGVTFSRAGGNLTLRLRQLAFKTIVNQDMSFFDDHENSVGALCTRLATDASAIEGATGLVLATFTRIISGLTISIVIGFIYCWEMTLVMLGFAPILLASSYLMNRLRAGALMDPQRRMDESGQIAMEAVGNIRTIATFSIEKHVHGKYSSAIADPYKNKKRAVHTQAVAYSFSQAMMMFVFATSFYVAALVVNKRHVQFGDLLVVAYAILFTSISAGQASSFAPNFRKAKTAASRMLALLDKKPKIQSPDETHVLPEVTGSIVISDLYFNYPSRPGVTVLQDLHLAVKPGQTVALVGSSGCGKSTTVQLLERFYDPGEGQVTIDGHNIRDLNLQWLRSQIGLVSQEPILFHASIRDNIAYGDNSRQVTMTEIIEAARNANIHNFIESLPEGYETSAGDKGTQLSGGQKQRIAIARALVRNPKILLLDEATSALDTESEKIVQAALDRAQEGRTCIVIAHRLSTIHNADCIVVIHQGHVVEMGTHSELMKLKDRYCALSNAHVSVDS